MPSLTKDPKPTLNVVKLFADLPQEVILFLNNLKIPQGKSMSFFLANHLEGYLSNQGGYRLKKKDILLLRQLPGTEYNNFSFYANRQLIEKLDLVASHNIRNRKEQTTFFLYALYCKLVGSQILSAN